MDSPVKAKAPTHYLPSQGDLREASSHMEGTTASQSTAPAPAVCTINPEPNPPPYHEFDRPRVPASHQSNMMRPRESDAESLLPSYANVSRWGRFKTEKEYLAALRAWADEKQFMVPVDGRGVPATLIGFYGKKTSADYLEGARRQEEEVRAWKCRTTVTLPEGSHAAHRGAGEATAVAAMANGREDDSVSPLADESTKRRRRSSIRDWVRRK